MSVHTAEQLETLLSSTKGRQQLNKLKSYYKTLKGYQSVLVRKDKEEQAQFERRKIEQKNNPAYQEYIAKEAKLTRQELIEKIIEMEDEKKHIGDLPRLDNYDLLFEKENLVGDLLWSANEGKRQNNINYELDAPQLESINKALGIKIRGQPESAAAAASVEKSEEVEEASEQEEEPIKIGKQEEEQPVVVQQPVVQQSVGADPNTIIDPIVTRGKVEGFEKKFQEFKEGKMKKEEHITNLKEYMNILKPHLYKKEHVAVSEEYEKVGKELQELENDVQGMVVMGQRQTTGSMQAVNPEPEVKKMTTRRVPEEVLEQKQESTSLPASSSAPKTAYDVLTSGSTKYKVEEAVSFEDIPYGQNDKSIGDVRKIGIGVYDELAKKDDILPSLSQREKSLKRFADFKWITQGGNNNSALADMSPFQKIDDMEYKLRYGQTFKIKAKIPFDITKRPDLVKRCETKYMMKPDFVPVSKIMTVEQPSTPIGFAETAEAASLVRNVLINEKGFDNSKNMEFIPKYEDRPKPSNPFSICTGLQSYYPNEMVEIPVNDPLQKPSIIIHPDTNSIMYV
jgi:hypothetical protein